MERKVYVRIIPLCFLTILFARCAPLIYAPNSVTMPLPAGPQEINISGAAGTERIAGAISYALDSHWVAMGTYDHDFNLVRGHGLTTTAGGGCYANFRNEVIAEVIAGVGYGENHVFFDQKASKPVDSVYHMDMNSSYGRVFVQADAGFISGNSVFGFSFRFSGLQTAGRYIFTASRIGDSVPASVNNYNLNGQQLLFLEPSFQFTSGWGPVKYFFNIGCSLPCNTSPLLRVKPLLYEEAYISTGLKLVLNASTPK